MRDAQDSPGKDWICQHATLATVVGSGNGTFKILDIKKKKESVGSSFSIARAKKSLSCPASSVWGQPGGSCGNRSGEDSKVAGTEGIHPYRDVAAQAAGSSQLVYDATWW